MKQKLRMNTLILLGSFTLSIPVSAAQNSDEALAAAEAQLQAEYRQAIAMADKSQAEADASIERAREQLHLASTAQNLQLVEQAEMREKLNEAHRQLRESSREISRINRQMARTRMAGQSDAFVFSSGDRPVLGVILGATNDVGIEVLGVSPDGPAERAGVEAGDVVIAVGGRVLAAVDESGDPRRGLNVALADIKADEAVIVSVERGSETLDLSVVPEVREPLTWQSVVRFPSAASAPPSVTTSSAGGSHTILIEKIVVPEIDTEGLSEQIEQMRIEIEQRREFVMADGMAPMGQQRQYSFRFGDMSEMGDFALHDSHAWFGMPLAAGLRLAELDPALGEYFKSDRGVLVLKAKQDNALLLLPGDVILNVLETEVNSPADFMRALRQFEPGDEILIEIKRKRKNKTLKPVIEESQAMFFSPHEQTVRHISITTSTN